MRFCAPQEISGRQARIEFLVSDFEKSCRREGHKCPLEKISRSVCGYRSLGAGRDFSEPVLAGDPPWRVAASDTPADMVSFLAGGSLKFLS
jgi:hypothetical protein